MSNVPSLNIPVVNAEDTPVIIDGATGLPLDGTELPTEAPALTAPETPPVDAGEGPAPEAAAPEVPLEEPSPSTISADRGAPCDWFIVGKDDGIQATNRHSNEVYEGSIQGFNEMLRG